MPDGIYCYPPGIVAVFLDTSLYPMMSHEHLACQLWFNQRLLKKHLSLPPNSPTAPAITSVLLSPFKIRGFGRYSPAWRQRRASLYTKKTFRHKVAG